MKSLLIIKSLFLGILLLALIFAFGCTISLYSVYPKPDIKKSYEIGRENTVNTGSPFITIGNIYMRPAYRPRYAFQPPNPGVRNAPEINPSQIWIVRGVRRDGKINIIYPEWSTHISLDIFEDGTISESPWKNTSASGDITMAQTPEWKLPDKRLFEKIPGTPDDSPYLDNFKAELIYTGISKKTIKISYREFIKDMARPAFYQELNYDLDQSDIIQFRSLKIRVIYADNSGIKFIVVDDGGLPWIPKNR
jgi:hypothetical protein